MTPPTACLVGPFQALPGHGSASSRQCQRTGRGVVGRNGLSTDVARDRAGRTPLLEAKREYLLRASPESTRSTACSGTSYSDKPARCAAHSYKHRQAKSSLSSSPCSAGRVNQAGPHLTFQSVIETTACSSCLLGHWLGLTNISAVFEDRASVNVHDGCYGWHGHGRGLQQCTSQRHWSRLQ